MLKIAYKWTFLVCTVKSHRDYTVVNKICIGNVNLIVKNFFRDYIGENDWLPDAYIAWDWKDSDKESYLTLVRVMNLDNKGKNIKIDMGNILKVSAI